ENYKTGPFTMDLIEPHIALTHDRIDFDVSNLSLEKDYTKELGMRVDITQTPHSVQLETIVENIKHKKFQVLRPIDGEASGISYSGSVSDRINKMKQRGWTQLGKAMHVIPNPQSKYNAVLVPLPNSTNLYQGLVTLMNTIGTVQVLSIEQIKNPDVEAVYEMMKKLISKQCAGNNPNEKELFHGTKDGGIDGIVNDGFDDRFYKQGKWGYGAYFADTPKVSHAYTAPLPNGSYIMYYNKVLLGNQSDTTVQNSTLAAAPLGYHSVHGIPQPNMDEYIVYRYGQALPYLKITYKL
ncbi:unnamed protein product, partial [Didymodactylos carnosus]